ncbi:MAG: hypothetical protein KAR18_02485 [Spirochaetes bacterium]|nr:hypothetical protein [Spirochaetota bacterium]
MEIKKTEITKPLIEREINNVKIGQIFRVKVLKYLEKGRILVEFKGKSYSAVLDRNISSKLFIARVLKVSPKLELKFIKELDGKKPRISNEGLGALLQSKKSFIQKLITSDNFLVNLCVIMHKDKKNIKKSVKKSIKNQNILHSMTKKGFIFNRVAEYYVLQNLYNLFNYDTCNFLFPCRIDDNHYLCDLKVFDEENCLSNSFFLSISIDNERKIGFLVYMDYEAVICYVSSNDKQIEIILQSHSDMLINYLKSLKYNRKVDVQFVPHREQVFFNLKNIRKIDIKM